MGSKSRARLAKMARNRPKSSCLARLRRRAPDRPGSPKIIKKKGSVRPRSLRAKKSKSVTFADQVMEIEDGEGVDLSAAHETYVDHFKLAITLAFRPLKACSNTFFDVLRQPDIRLPKKNPLPPLFNFTRVSPP